jgi:hypothetical protein
MGQGGASGASQQNVLSDRERLGSSQRPSFSGNAGPHVTRPREITPPHVTRPREIAPGYETGEGPTFSPTRPNLGNQMRYITGGPVLNYSPHMVGGGPIPGADHPTLGSQVQAWEYPGRRRGGRRGGGRGRDPVQARQNWADRNRDRIAAGETGMRRVDDLMQPGGAPYSGTPTPSPIWGNGYPPLEYTTGGPRLPQGIGEPGTTGDRMMQPWEFPGRRRGGRRGGGRGRGRVEAWREQYMEPPGADQFQREYPPYSMGRNLSLQGPRVPRRDWARLNEERILAGETGMRPGDPFPNSWYGMQFAPDFSPGFGSPDPVTPPPSPTGGWGDGNPTPLPPPPADWQEQRWQEHLERNGPGVSSPGPGMSQGYDGLWYPSGSGPTGLGGVNPIEQGLPTGTRPGIPSFSDVSLGNPFDQPGLPDHQGLAGHDFAALQYPGTAQPYTNPIVPDITQPRPGPGSPFPYTRPFPNPQGPGLRGSPVTAGDIFGTPESMRPQAAADPYFMGADRFNSGAVRGWADQAVGPRTPPQFIPDFTGPLTPGFAPGYG